MTVKTYPNRTEAAKAATIVPERAAIHTFHRNTVGLKVAWAAVAINTVAVAVTPVYYGETEQEAAQKAQAVLLDMCALGMARDTAWKP